MNPTRRERIADVLREFQVVQLNDPRDVLRFIENPRWVSLLDALEAACTTPAITRAQVEAVFTRHSFIPHHEFIGDLLGLLGGEAEPRVWCRHLMWQSTGGGYWLYQDLRANPYGHRHEIRPTDDWDQCPVQGCHAPRPR